jgi:hypothetical protein
MRTLRLNPELIFTRHSPAGYFSCSTIFGAKWGDLYGKSCSVDQAIRDMPMAL